MIAAGVVHVTMLDSFSPLWFWRHSWPGSRVFPAHFAVIVHGPVPLVIETVVPLIEQAPATEMIGVMPVFVVAVTVNVDW